MFWHLLTKRWNRSPKFGTLGCRLAKPYRNLLTLEPLEDRTTPSNFSPTLPSQSFGSTKWDSPVFTGNTPLVPASFTFLDQELAGRIPLAELSDSEVVIIRPTGDPLVQIGNALAGSKGIETVRIISHGKAGALYLGGQMVDEAVVENQSSTLAGWGRALTADADILLYGCSVASTLGGREWVDSLARMTGADVAASIDPSGAGNER